MVGCSFDEKNSLFLFIDANLRLGVLLKLKKGCNTMKNNKDDILFGLGEPNEAYAEYFTKQSFLNMLVSDPDIDVSVANVTFEPGCRNNWHVHEAGGYQILLVTKGKGYYQEEGKEARRLQPGDIVVIKPEIKHWHGAQSDSWFTHLTITKGTTAWLEKVADEHYQKLKK